MDRSKLQTLGLGIFLLGLPSWLTAKTATIEEHWSITIPDNWTASPEYHARTRTDLYSFGQDTDTQYRDDHLMAVLPKGSKEMDEPRLNEGFSLLFVDGPADTMIGGDWSPIELDILGKKRSATMCFVTRLNSKLRRYAVSISSSDLPGFSSELSDRHAFLYITVKEESDLKIYLQILNTLVRNPDTQH